MPTYNILALTVCWDATRTGDAIFDPSFNFGFNILDCIIQRAALANDIRFPERRSSTAKLRDQRVASAVV